MHDVCDRPFGLPIDSIEIVLDLPFPPSVNHIWRRAGRNVIRSAKYLKWMESADRLIMAAKQYPRRKIAGAFEAKILLNVSAGRGDIDNRIKATLDWLQSRDVIAEDKHCRKLTVEWAEHEAAPAGCRVTLRSLHMVAA
jgi:Holliday junction resolvase RusA-like endonuclease